MGREEVVAIALQQGFYLSSQFQDLRFETLDYREHPVLGGISSTMWYAYESFASQNSKLLDSLRKIPGTSNAVQLRSKKESEKWSNPFLGTIGIDVSPVKDYVLRSSGFLSGSNANNRLTGSSKSDVIMGWEGRDIIIGGKDDDILSGGANADKFLFRAAHSGAETERDEIVDFNGKGGDRIVFLSKGGSVTTEFTGKKGEATVSSWTAKLVPHSDPVYPWEYSGSLIEVDRDGDKTADLQIDLPGVTWMNPDWIKFV